MVNCVKIFTCLLFVLLCNCSTEESAPRPEGIRIVSISPGITASIIDLGLQHQIVGRSAFCEQQVESIQLP